MNIFWGYEDFVDIFGGSSQNWASLRVITMQFGVFFKGQGTELRYFFGLLKSQIFFGGLEIPDIFWGRTVDAGSEPTYAEKIRVPPPPPPWDANHLSYQGCPKSIFHIFSVLTNSCFFFT